MPRNKMTGFLTGIGLVVLLLSFALVVNAQVVEDDVFLEVSPDFPAPNETVTFELNSYIVDIDRYPIQWKIDGKVVKSGVGERKISAPSGPVGTRTIVEGVIKLTNFTEFKKVYVLQPASTDIIWQGQGSYVPPFYKGRKLPAREGLVKFVGIPDPHIQNDAVFTWQENFKVVRDASGFGKESFVVKSDILDEDQSVTLIATGRSTGFAGRSIIEAPLVFPEIHIFESDATGVLRLNRNLANQYRLNNNEEYITAVPLFYSTINPKEFDVEWQINVQKLQLKEPTILIQRGPQTGPATIKVHIENPEKIFQDEDVTVNIQI